MFLIGSFNMYVLLLHACIRSMSCFILYVPISPSASMINLYLFQLLFELHTHPHRQGSSSHLQVFPHMHASCNLLALINASPIECFSSVVPTCICFYCTLARQFTSIATSTSQTTVGSQRWLMSATGQRLHIL